MKKYLSLIIVLILAVGSVFYLIYNETQKDNKLNNINQDGSFVVSKDLKIQNDFTKKELSMTEINWYMDTYCGDCIRTHKNIHEQIIKEINNGNLEIKYYPLNFLPHKTKTDYSLKTAAFILGTAEYEPDKVIPLMDSIFNKDFREKNKTIENYSFLVELADKLEMNKTNKIIKNIKQFENIVNEKSLKIRENEELKKHSPTGKVFVPFIFENKENSKAFDGENENTENAVLKPLNELIKSNCKIECK